MTKDLSSQQTTVIASYGTRRDAEIARDYLEEAGVSASIRADDAGGMHPELQRSQGVHVVVLESTVTRAYDVLRRADLLPLSTEENDTKVGDPVAEATPWSGIRVLLWVFAGLIGAMVLRLLLW